MKKRNILIIVTLIASICAVYFVYKLNITKKNIDQEKKIYNINTLPKALNIEIRNSVKGSNKAKELADELEKKGYQITLTETSMAHMGTAMYVKSGVNPIEIIKLIQGTVLANIPTGEKEFTTDMLVIVGK